MHGVCSLPVKQRELGATPSAGATFPIPNGACDVIAAYLPVKEAVRGRIPSGTPLSAMSLNAKQSSVRSFKPVLVGVSPTSDANFDIHSPSSSMSRKPDSQSGKPCASHGEGATFPLGLWSNEKLGAL